MARLNRRAIFFISKQKAVSRRPKAESGIAFCFLLSAFYLPIFIFSSPALFAANSHSDFYQTIAPEDILRASSRFVVVDDFSSGKLSHDEKEKWEAKTPRGGKASLASLNKDGRNPKRGHSLRVTLKLSAAQTVDLQKSLNHLDISQASHFLFRVRTNLKQSLLPGKILASFIDRNFKRAELDVTAQIEGKTDQWVTVSAPMSFFKELDLDQLLSFSLRIRPAKKPIEGTIDLDEITFFGEENLNFQSSRDNIVGFPDKVFDNARRERLKQESDRKFLWIIAKDTWKFFENAIDKKTQLVVDNIKVGENPVVSGYTSPTNIAMNLLSIIAALDLKIISNKEALSRTRALISTIAQMKKHEGFLLNFYETKNLIVTRSYVSSVDNGWLAIALVVSRQAFYQELWSPITQLLGQMNFNDFLDGENNQLVIGYDVPLKNFGGHHYGMLVSEARATSLLAIGKEDIDPEHWWYLYRTPPAAWKWQSQPPKGDYAEHNSVEYFQGYYEKDGKKFVPSWGGSLFEFLMPTLVIDEKNLAPKSLGMNDRIATELHRDYALKEKGYPIWGISPASSINGKSWKYEELGVKSLGVKGYPDKGIVTPHVGFLALESLPDDAILNLRKYLDYEIYGDYGYFDSLDLQTGKANPQYLSLDQGMILVAICNYLKQGSIQKRFERDPIGAKIKEILSKETFFKP